MKRSDHSHSEAYYLRYKTGTPTWRVLLDRRTYGFSNTQTIPPEHTIAPCKPHHPAKHAFSTQQHTPYSDDNDGNRRRLRACVPRGQRRRQRGGSAATTRRRREQWRQRHAHGAARAAAKAKRAKVPNLCTHCWECQVSDIFIRAESRVRLRAAYLASCPAHTEWAVAGGGRPPPNSLTALGCSYRVGTAESRTWHE